MRRLSLVMRDAQDDDSSAEVTVALFKIEHQDVARPVRLSTDNTERLSEDPLLYGTRSTWLTADPDQDPFIFLPLSTELPSDLDDAVAGGNVVFDNVSHDIATTLRSFPDKATIHMAVVLASQPNVIEAAWTGMLLDSADITAGEIRLVFSREDIEEEMYPSDRMTRNTYPGMHR